ncbi:hypothetical protein [Mucilaginibacter sp. SP1R1]|uniref:hypothetical protein n=1 Tax=Mucilaginibacter sp. SP1R1 TaxID=2723091 RepID=UPI001620A1CA|nr:hypothetical protein [Mucilaginibacter sp. SP1R1]MBB6148322.1 hypothetical protein [Mucilaginibacter sp. SP1R1]
MTALLSFHSYYLLFYVIQVTVFLYLKKQFHLLAFLFFIQSSGIMMMIWTGNLTAISYSLLLLNGPVLYLIHLKSTSTAIAAPEKIIHLLPFSAALFIFNLFHNISWHNNYTLAFYNLSTTLAGFSPILYASIVCHRLNNTQHQENSKPIRLRLLCYMVMVNGTFNILMQLKAIGVHLDLGLNGNALGYPINLLAVLFNTCFQL